LTTAAPAFAAWWTEFFAGQFAVAVFVKFAESGGRIVDFIRVDHAIAVRVESGEDRIAASARALAISGFVLSVERDRRGAQNRGGKNQNAFHIIPFNQRRKGGEKVTRIADGEPERCV
jgi:hypothetical protein